MRPRQVPGVLLPVQYLWTLHKPMGRRGHTSRWSRRRDALPVRIGDIRDNLHSNRAAYDIIILHGVCALAFTSLHGLMFSKTDAQAWRNKLHNAISLCVFQHTPLSSPALLARRKQSPCRLTTFCRPSSVRRRSTISAATHARYRLMGLLSFAIGFLDVHRFARIAHRVLSPPQLSPHQAPRPR